MICPKCWKICKLEFIELSSAADAKAFPSGVSEAQSAVVNDSPVAEQSEDGRG